MQQANSVSTPKSSQSSQPFTSSHGSIHQAPERGPQSYHKQPTDSKSVILLCTLLCF